MIADNQIIYDCVWILVEFHKLYYDNFSKDKAYGPKELEEEKPGQENQSLKNRPTKKGYYPWEDEEPMTYDPNMYQGCKLQLL